MMWRVTYRRPYTAAEHLYIPDPGYRPGGYYIRKPEQRIKTRAKARLRQLDIEAEIISVIRVPQPKKRGSHAPQ